MKREISGRPKTLGISRKSLAYLKNEGSLTFQLCQKGRQIGCIGYGETLRLGGVEFPFDVGRLQLPEIGKDLLQPGNNLVLLADAEVFGHVPSEMEKIEVGEFLDPDRDQIRGQCLFMGIPCNAVSKPHQTLGRNIRPEDQMGIFEEQVQLFRSPGEQSLFRLCFDLGNTRKSRFRRRGVR